MTSLSIPAIVEASDPVEVSPGRYEVTVKSWLVMPTEKATRQILRAIAKGKREAIITGHGKALVILERFLPWMLRAAGRKMAAGRGGYGAEPKSLRKIEEDES